MHATTHPPKSIRHDVGGGFYSLGELRLYVALHGSPSDGKQVLTWLTEVLNRVERTPRRPDHNFSDLVSLFVVRELRKKGVKPGAIRDAEAYLRKLWRTDRPFVSDEIKTDGTNVFVHDEVISGQIEAADLAGQQTMREAIKERLTDVKYHDGTAAYWTPMKGVLVDPRVQFGEPVIDGTRVPTQAVWDLVQRMDPEDAASHLGITRADARVALAFQQKLASFLP